MSRLSVVGLRWSLRIALSAVLLGASQAAERFADYGPLFSDYPVSAAPETETEIGAAYPALRSGYQRLAESGYLEMFPEYKVRFRTTPHVPWATPWAGGTLRVLFVKNTGVAGADVREIVERLDCEFERLLCPFGNSPDIHPAVLDFSNERNLKVLEQPFDVVFLSPAVDGDNVRPAVREKLIEKIKAGMGVVFLTSGNYKPGPICDDVCGVAPIDGKNFRASNFSWTQGALPRTQPHFLTTGVPWQAFPPVTVWASKPREGAQVLASFTAPGNHLFPLMTASQCGKGRVVTLVYNNRGGSGNEYAPAGDQWARPGRYWEYPFAFLVRAALWAAGREGTAAPDLTLAAEAAWGAPLPVELRVGPLPAGNCTAEFTVCDEAGDEMQAFRRKVSEPSSRFTLEPPDAPAGMYSLNVILRDAGGRSLGYASAVFRIRGPVSVSLTADPQYLEPGGRFRVSMQVTAETNGIPPADMTAAIEFVDTWGRVVERREIPSVAAGRVIGVGKFSTARSRGALLTIRALIETHGRALAEGRTEVYTPRFGWDDFNLVYWMGWHSDYDLGESMQAYRALGCAGLYMPVWSAASYRRAAMNNIGIVSAANGWFARGNVEKEKEHIHHYLSDPQAEETERKFIGPATKEVRKYGTLWANLCDEPCLVLQANAEVDYSPFVLGKLREHLKKTYGPDIAALNAGWGTRFASWDEVKPDFIADAVKRDGNFAPWLDHKLFVDRLFEEAYGGFDPIYKELAGRHVDYGPDGLFGFQPGYVPAGGMDYARICRPGRRFSTYGAEWGMNPHYGHVKCWNIVRSYLEPWKMLTLTSGSVYTPYYMLANDAWYTAFNGGSGYLVYMGISHYSSYGSYYRRAVATREATRELREGVGKLLMASRPEPAQAGILYVHPSYYLRTLLDTKESRSLHVNYQNSRYAFERLCLDLQVPLRYVRWTEPNAGELAGLKVLCLTGCDVLPDEWAAAIRQFVQGGGAVVADLLPGWYDIHGRARGKGAIDDLFGVARSANRIVEMAPGFTAGTMTRSRELDAYAGWPSVDVFEGGVRVTDGEKMGDNFAHSAPPRIDWDTVKPGQEPEVKYVAETQPAFVFKRTGKGFSFLFNFLLDQYVFHPDDQFRQFFLAILDKQGISRSSQVGSPESPAEPLPHLVVNRYWAGGGRIEHLAALRDYGLGGDIPVDLRASFRAPGHLYDVRAGRYLGHGNEATIRMEPGAGLGARLVTRLPYRVEKLTVRGPRSVRRGEDAVLDIAIVTAGGEAAAEHVFRIETADPQGKPAAPYCGNVVAPGGRTEYVIPFALNERPGTWRIAVRDVISSSQAVQEIKVR